MRILNVIKNSGPIKISTIFVLALIPLFIFLDKPFHIDDTLFIYTARQILKEPLRPFDFLINWETRTRPMWAETKNPPLVSYYIAFVVRMFGEKEHILHLSFMPCCLLAIWSVYLLGKRFSRAPFLATLLFTITPAFIVCSNSIMSDVPALAIYLLALYLFVLGNDRDSGLIIQAAYILAGITILMKYSGFTLLPIFLAYHFLNRKDNKRLIYLLIPVLIVSIWHFHTLSLYGKSHIADSSEFSWRVKLMPKYWLLQTLSIFSFLSGTTFYPIFTSPFLFNIYQRRRLAVLLVVLFALLASIYPLQALYYPLDQCILMFILAFSAMSMFAFLGKDALRTARDLRNESHADRDVKGASDKAFLYVWFLMALLFVFSISWCVAARFVLLILPPLSILISNAFIEHRISGRKILFIVLTATYLFSLILECQEFRFASALKNGAYFVSSKLNLPRDSSYFFGDWGFKYYLEKAGFRPLDEERAGLKKGDFVAGFLFSARSSIKRGSIVERVPLGFLRSRKIEDADPILELTSYAVAKNEIPLSITNKAVHAGFHSSNHGILPFVFSNSPAVIVAVWIVARA